MRLWLLLRRRRRVLTLVVTSGLAFLLVTSFGFPGHSRTTYEAFDNSDYDLNYDSVDAVHAMVRQMSSIKRRNQLQFDEDPQEPNPGQPNLNQEDPLPADTALRFEPANSKQRQNAKKRKIRLGIGDYPDIPDDVPKKYSFIHQALKSTTPQTRTPRPVPEQQLNVDQQEGNRHDTHQSNHEDYLQDGARNPQDDNYDEDYTEDDEDEKDDDDENIIEAPDTNEEENENYNEDEYEEYENPNPVFKQEDFDPLPANASAHNKKTFQFEELRTEDRESRLHHYEEREEAGDYYEDNNREEDDAALEHDTHVNGRMLHSKVNDVVAVKKTAEPHQRDVYDNPKALASDITRLHTPLKRQENDAISHGKKSHRHYPPLDRRNTNNNNGHSNVLFSTKVPKVDASFRQNLQQNVIQTPTVNKSDKDPEAWDVGGFEVPATQIQTPRLPRQLGPVVYSNDGYAIVEDSIFWTQKVDKFVPKGLSEYDVRRFVSRVKRLPVSELHAARWNRCGRAKNQFALLSDGTAACARYRDPHNKLIHGEVLSFYLSRLLGLDSVPSVALAQINTSTPQWRGVNVTRAQWDEGKMVAMIQWIDDLDIERSRVKMPAIMLNSYDTGATLDRHHPALLAMTPAELAELVQWSDMVLLDYITGHYDRFASMQDGADREQRPSILAESVRNLRKVPATGKMWLIDNESGLFDAYELLYRGGEMGRKFVEFHQKMLRTFCIFRRNTVDRVLELAAHSSPHELLLKHAHKAEPLLEQMPRTAEHKLFNGYFHTRLKEVKSWMQKCQGTH